jgi:glycosyltransferase involved in cell wall biosynthesis
LAHDLRVPLVFTGRVLHSDIPGLLAQIDLFVIPRRDLPITRHAGPLKLVEAMMAGRAIIASPLGDIPDLVADGAGVLLPGDSVDELAAALVQWGRDPAGRALLGAQARARGSQLLTWHAAATHHAEIYGRVLSR